MANKRHPQQHWLVDEKLQPTLRSVSRRAQAKIREPARILVDQSVDTKFLCESRQLASRRRALREIDEMGLRPAFGEEAQRLSRVGALFHAKDLDIHACRTCGAGVQGGRT